MRKDIIERDPNGRIAMTANNIYDRYQKYNAVNGTQLVFSDMGMPKKQAEKALKEYNELTEQAAPLQDEAIRAMADLGMRRLLVNWTKPKPHKRRLMPMVQIGYQRLKMPSADSLFTMTCAKP